MHLNNLLFRFRWIQVPAGMLILLLQRTPVLRVLVQVEGALANNATAIMRSAFVVAGFGAYNSVAGATVFNVTATPVAATPTSGAANAKFAVTDAAGTAMSVGISVSGAPGNPKSYSVTGTLPTGVSVTGGSPVNVTAPYKMTIAGTPAAAGIFPVTVTAWSGTNASGDSAKITVTFTITGGVADVAPSFTTQPASLTVTAGGVASFAVAANGTPAPTYQWQKGGVNIAGATGTAFSIASAATGDAGIYTAVATNSAGSATSNAATLTVSAAATAPALTSQPTSQTVTTGSSVSFTVAASGSPTPTYQWRKGGVDVAGATGATYTIASVVAGDAGDFAAVATNSAGSATSNVATLTVSATATAPAITTQPTGVTVTAGGAASFTVAASGNPTPTYQWQKGGVNIAGATGATYTIASTAVGDAGSYTAVATNIAGSATSNAATLTVNTSATAPAITLQPANVTVMAGGSASFAVAASGSPTPTYQWRKGGVNIAGATSATYTIVSVVTGDAGSYTAVATNSGGSATSTAATLTVSAATAPTITTQPTAKTATAGSPVSFTVVATGSPAPTYQWRKAAVSIAGATSATYSIANTVSGDAGNYSVVVTNSAGAVTSNTASLTINALPTFTTQPVSQAVFIGATLSLTAATSGGIPVPTYQWQKNGITISGATGLTLNLTNIQLTDAGSYGVVATSAAGTVTSKFGRLVVLAPLANAITYGTTVVPSGVTAGGMVNLSYFTTNVGTNPWGSNHYLSIRDINSTFVAFSSLIGVLPGESKSANLSFSAPATPGTYTYYVQALENGVQFFSTQTTVTLTVLATQPNSITYNTTNFPVSAAPGSGIIFNYNVTNSGTKTWGSAHNLVVKNSTGTTLSSTPLTVLAPGSSKTVNLSFTAPTAPGTYTYTVRAAETGVGNFNTLVNLTLVVLAPQPNAIVYTPTRLPDEVMPGVLVNLHYTVSNAGTQAWGANHYMSLRDGNGTYLSFIPVSGVAPAGTSNVAFSFTAPSTPGVYAYFVQALENGIEFFFTQDVVILTVLAPPLPNAISYNATTFPRSVMRGSTVSFTHNVTNRGTKTWGANHYLSLRDVDSTFLGFPALAGLAPGASQTFSYSFVAPAAPGIYTYFVQGFESGVEFFVMADTLVLTVQ